MEDLDRGVVFTVGRHAYNSLGRFRGGGERDIADPSSDFSQVFKLRGERVRWYCVVSFSVTNEKARPHLTVGLFHVRESVYDHLAKAEVLD